MELLYIWIEKYKKIENQGFNFSPRYTFEFDFGKNELTCKENENPLPDNFFGDNITNVTAIVGENGSGKTSLLNFLITKPIEICKYVLIIKEKKSNTLLLFNNNCKVLNKEKIEDSLKDLKIEYIEKSLYSYLYDNKDYKRPQLIFSSNVFYPGINIFSKDLNGTDYLTNVSSNYLFETKNKKEDENLISSFSFDELLRLNKIIDFIDDNTEIDKNIKEILGFNKNSGITRLQIVSSSLIIINRDESLNGLFDLYIKNNPTKTKQIHENFFILIMLKIITKLLNQLQEKAQFDKENNVSNTITYQNELQILNNEIKNDKNALLDENKDTLYENTKVKIDSLIKDTKNFDRKILKFKEKEDFFKTSYLNFYNELSKRFLNFEYDNDFSIFKELKNTKKEDIFIKFIDLLLTNEYDFDLENSTVKSSIDRKELEPFLDIYSTFLSEYFQYDKYYAKNYFLIGFLEFDWGLSSGQLSMLNIYARLLLANNLKFINDNYDKISSHIVLLDEADLYLHPEWSRNNIFLLTSILPKIFKKPVQIILTTHSPFVVSDLPKENIIFLNREKTTGQCVVVPGIEKEKTFGQNIHTLLSNSFFMQDGLIGEFAKEKINKILRFHNLIKRWDKKDLLKHYFKQYKKDFEKIQSMIGEDIIANYVKNCLTEINEILNINDDENEIKQLIKKYGISKINEIFKNDTN